MAKKPPSTDTPSEPIAEFLGPEVLIEYVPTESIKLWEGNPRLNDPAVPEVMKSIKEYGFLVPVVVGKDMVVKAGNTRLKAARKLGLKRIPIVRAEHLDEDQLVRFALVDNQVSQISTFDYKKIPYIVPLHELPNLPGFDKSDVEKIRALVAQDNYPKKKEAEMKQGGIKTLITCPHCNQEFEGKAIKKSSEA